jgi:penicillin-binding protein 2
VAVDRDLFLRSQIFRILIVALFLLLGGNLFFMMVPRHDYYKEQALENRQVRFRVRAPRGRILDRDGVLLADNMYLADITLPRSCLVDAQPDSTLERLMYWFDLPREETIKNLERQKKRRRGPLVLAHNARISQISAVEERERQLPGVMVDSRMRRRYLFGPLFAHIIGHVGEVSQATLDTSTDKDGYRQGDIVGRLGIEAAFENEMRGSNGVKLEEVNASGRIVGQQTVWLEEIIPGQDVRLSLSVPLQDAMADAMGDQVACGVAMSTTTGEVLAAYSNPSYDPNLLTVSISAEDWNALANDPAKPFLNRIVQASYPPGSIYKPVTSLAALSLGLVDTSSFLEPCLGGWQFGNRYFKCWKHSGHGEVDHTDALVHSCDTYYYQLGLRLTIDQMAESARDIGLGRRCSGVFAEEVSGNIPDSAWYDNRFGPGKWTRGVLLNNSIGQGEILVTPLQMALLSARLASSGKVPDPVFILDPVTSEAEPWSVPFSEPHLSWCREAMFQVVERGTGNKAQVEGVSVAGKTGTAQNSGEDHAWFICFAPMENPEVAMAVIVENAGHGGSVAAPIARQWLEAYFGVGDTLNDPQLDIEGGEG